MPAPSPANAAALPAPATVSILVGAAAPKASSGETAAIAGALAWPLCLALVIALFRQQIAGLLTGTRGLEFDLFGQTFKLSMDKAESLLQSVITELFDKLTPEENHVLDRVASGSGQETVLDILPDFARDNHSHMVLRSLRGRRLIDRAGGGVWEADSRPIRTKLLEILLKANPSGLPFRNPAPARDVQTVTSPAKSPSS